MIYINKKVIENAIKLTELAKTGELAKMIKETNQPLVDYFNSKEKDVKAKGE